MNSYELAYDNAYIKIKKETADLLKSGGKAVYIKDDLADKLNSLKNKEKLSAKECALMNFAEWFISNYFICGEQKVLEHLKK